MTGKCFVFAIKYLRSKRISQQRNNDLSQDVYEKWDSKMFRGPLLWNWLTDIDFTLLSYS